MLPIQAQPVGVMELLTQIAIVLLIGVALKAGSRKSGFPFIVALILAGSAFASIDLLKIEIWGNFTELIRTLALIIVVFSAGFHLKLGAIKKDSKIILILSTLGVLITFAIITGITYSLLNISLITAAFLGALLSGSDSAAISASSETKDRVTTILLSESVFNQPLTLILPLLLLDYLIKPELAWLQLPKFAMLIIVGIVIGVLGALIGQKILLALKAEHEEIAGLMIAISVFVIAENFFGSGILAVAITALLLSNRQTPEKEVLGKFSRQLAFIFTIFVFVLLGMQFSFQHLAQLSITREEIITIIVALVVARLGSSLIVLFRTKLSSIDKIKISLISPKGLAPAALAPLLLMHGFSDATMVVKIVYIAIIASIFISMIFMRYGVEQKTLKEKAAEKTIERKIKKVVQNGKKKQPASKPLLK